MLLSHHQTLKRNPTAMKFYIFWKYTNNPNLSLCSRSSLGPHLTHVCTHAHSCGAFSVLGSTSKATGRHGEKHPITQCLENRIKQAKPNELIPCVKQRLWMQRRGNASRLDASGMRIQGLLLLVTDVRRSGRQTDERASLANPLACCLRRLY